MWWRTRRGLYEETFELSPDKKEETSQLDYIIGPMRRNDEDIHNDGRLWATWDHYPVYARIQEAGRSKILQKGKKKWIGWTPKAEMQAVEFRKKVMEKYDDTEDDLAAIQRTIENAAGKVARYTKAEREVVVMSTPENVRVREDAARFTAKIKRRVLKKQARKARAEHHVRCCLEPGKKKANRKPERAVH